MFTDLSLLATDTPNTDSENLLWLNPSTVIWLRLIKTYHSEYPLRNC